MNLEQRRRLARLAAPAAFLLAVTIFVLIVRAGMGDDEAATTAQAPTTASAATRAQPAATTTQAPATTAATVTTTGEELYEIQSGDTLETVAAEHGTTVDALVELNPGIDPRQLTIGQEIRVR